MPITSEWYNAEKTILYARYDGHWTLEDYYHNYATAARMMREVGHPVVAITDFSTSGPIPPSFMTVGNYSDRTRAPNNIKVIVCGVNAYLRILRDIFSRMFPGVMRDMILTDTLEQAIREAQRTLNEAAQPARQGTEV
ncbi:MAG: hypothetical protein MUE40_21670 [Anaerolineae bacterium]|nr:hypothetical protein [Anaerolineae bacterium]